MARGLTRAGVCVAAACALLWLSAAAAVAKGPDQAVVSGPGLDHPVVVRPPGSPTVVPDISSLIQSSGILNQLWCTTCRDLSPKQTAADLGPMYLVRYRVPSLIGGPTRWVEQHVYPFAHPRPLTFVAPGQRFWDRRTVGGWYQAGPLLRTTLVDIGLPRSSTASPPAVDTASATPVWFSVGLAAGGIAVVTAIIVGLFLLERAWARTRSATHAHSS
jgi:hypothetical protein